MKATWKKASDYTWECFDRWGYKPETPILETVLHNPDGVRYELTILKRGKLFVPMHGLVMMEAVKTLRNAKIDALDWFHANNH